MIDIFGNEGTVKNSITETFTINVSVFTSFLFCFVINGILSLTSWFVSGLGSIAKMTLQLRVTLNL